VVVEILDANTFIYAITGRYNRAHGLQQDEWFYLSEDTPGALTQVEPDISQPLVYAENANYFTVYAYRPTYPNDDQFPIFAGAGTTGLVPDPITEEGYVLSDSGEWVPGGVGGGGGMVDGGFANSVYTPPQLIDGGSAAGGP
jgi:hypothetical protein